MPICVHFFVGTYGFCLCVYVYISLQGWGWNSEPCVCGLPQSTPHPGASVSKSCPAGSERSKHCPSLKQRLSGYFPTTSFPHSFFSRSSPVANDIPISNASQVFVGLSHLAFSWVLCLFLSFHHISLRFCFFSTSFFFWGGR